MPAQVKVPVRPKDPPFMQPLASRSQDGWENPRNWSGNWQDYDKAGQHLWDLFHRTDACGDFVQRIILEPEMRTPDAWGHQSVGGGAGWEAIDPYHKQLIIDITMERRREDRNAGRPEITVGFYNGCINDGMPGLISNHTNRNVVDITTDKGLDAFRRQWEPWVECEVLSELNHDAGTSVANTGPRWEAVKKLLEQQWVRFGLYGLTEAILWTDNTGTPPNRYTWAPYDGVDMWCISRFILQRDPIGQLVWPWAHPLQPSEDDSDRRNIQGLPASVWIMNSAHTLSDGSSGLLTEEQARDYANRGWGVGSWTSNHGADQIVNLPPRVPSVRRPSSAAKPTPRGRLSAAFEG